MKPKMNKLKSMKKKDKSNTSKLSAVNDAEKLKLSEVKISYMDLVDEDVWDYMNDIDDQDLKCLLD